MNKKELTKEDMEKKLQERARRIFSLSSKICTLDLAHAFCRLSGHVKTIDCVINPIDATYTGAHDPTIPVARLEVRLDFFEHMNQLDARKAFDSRMVEIGRYTRTLNRIIRAGQPVTQSSELAA